MQSLTIQTTLSEKFLNSIVNMVSSLDPSAKFDMKKDECENNLDIATKEFKDGKYDTYETFEEYQKAMRE